MKILNEIENRRNEIRKHAHEKFMDEMLDKMGAPVKWIGYKSMDFEHNFRILTHSNIFFLIDIVCEMDLLQCQKIRKLTTLYRRLKNSTNDVEAKIERIEFISELHVVLVREPHSTLLEEVRLKLFMVKLLG